jgi:hypothetical protein
MKQEISIFQLITIAQAIGFDLSEIKRFDIKDRTLMSEKEQAEYMFSCGFVAPEINYFYLDSIFPSYRTALIYALSKYNVKI